MQSTILFIVLAVALAACNSREATPSVKLERPAMTQVVGAEASDAGRIYSGEIRARHEFVMGFRVAGKIAERLVETGAQVMAGQVLARLDPADAVLQAGAAQAQYQLALSDAKRYRELHSKGFVSQSALDAKETSLTAAQAQAGLTRNQSDYTTLRAEHDGVIAAILAEAGQVVGIGQPVLRLAQSGEREVAIEIPEAAFAMRHVGDAATVELLAMKGAPLTGRLRELSQVADPVSRTYAARVALVMPSGQITEGQAALGMTARVRFDGGHRQSGELLIPLSAIYQKGRQTAVWIVAADHSVSQRVVEVAAYRDNGAVIAGGLSAGERIVSAGVHRLSPGEKILAVEAATGSAQ
jgi:membrane fusion protein, multidrug efflux system